MAALARSLFLPLLLVPALAYAQQPDGPTGTPLAPPPAPSATSSGPAAPAGPVTGYGWGGDPRPAQAPPIRHYYAPAGPTALLPGFEEQSDGSSRFFVELTKAVPVVEQRGKGTITYVLKGAHVAVYNNYRPLVTVHFNTPVWRARLTPRGADLQFVLEMRANAAPAYKVDVAPTGRAMLEIDFPAGQFLASDMPELPAPGGPPPPSGGPPPVPTSAPAPSSSAAPSAPAPSSH